MRIFILFLAVLGMMQSALRAQTPSITNQPASRTLWVSGNVAFVLGVSSPGAFTYQWQSNGTNLPGGIITTVAGNGTYDYSGDGGAATLAGLSGPSCVAVDAAGNLFIADYNNNRVRKVDTNGIITTVAGTGARDYSGDGGAATNAGIWDAACVAVDAVGNLFIADYGNGTIRKVDTNGIITTVAGNTGQGYSGDGDTATNASLNGPISVAVDTAGDLFIADSYNNVIRKVSTNGIITTVAGNGTQGNSGDGGSATNASLNWPAGVALDANGNLLIVDTCNGSVRKVDTNGIIITVVGNGTTDYSGDGGSATNASLNYPRGVVADAAGNLFITDTGTCRIRKVDTNGIITTVAGNGKKGCSGDGGAATNAQLSFTSGVTVDAFGNLFIAETAIRKVTNTQGPALALNNVAATDAGTYQVVVTGADVSVTSSVVNLIVADWPMICRTVPNSDGSVSLGFVCQPGSTNVVLCATNLVPPVDWESLSTNLAGADGNWQFTDTNTANYQMRFYRSLTR